MNRKELSEACVLARELVKEQERLKCLDMWHQYKLSRAVLALADENQRLNALLLMAQAYVCGDLDADTSDAKEDLAAINKYLDERF